MNGIFILFEGVDSTIFASQVAQHAHDMGKNGARLRVLVLEPNRKNWQRSVRNKELIEGLYPDLQISLKPCVSLFLPFSMLINLFILAHHFRRMSQADSVDFIHARADYCASLCVLLRLFFRIPIIWDCRGAAHAELKALLERKLKGPLAIGRVFFYLRQRWIAFLCNRFCAAAIFVSNSLEQLFNFRLSVPVVIIPCSVSENRFYFDPVAREKQRDEWGVQENQVVLLYAGGLAKYQGFDLIQDCLAAHAEQSDVRLIMVTPDPEKAADLFPTSLQKKLLFTSSSFDGMNRVYNGADIGILLRHPGDINAVASPTKFGEYCMTGLPVISNGTVDQVQSITEIIGNYVSPDTAILQKASPETRKQMSVRARDFFGRKSNNTRYLELYETVAQTQGNKLP